MSRDFQINGETLVKVKGVGGLLAEDGTAGLHELGLAAQGIVVAPRFHHRDVHVDDFGPNCPAEVQWLLAEVSISMLLIHYDRGVLDACIGESMGGTDGGDAGIFAAGGGLPLGGGWPRFNPDCHYVSLNLLSPVLDYPWRFLTCYLADQPAQLPVGTSKTIATVNWRAIPYSPLYVSGAATGSGSFSQSGVTYRRREQVSAGTILWDHILDTGN